MSGLVLQLENEEWTHGVEISDAIRTLDRLATKIGITPISDFFSVPQDEAEGFLEAHDIDSDEVPIPEHTPFSADVGLTTVRGLIKHLKENPDALRKSDAVIEDLVSWEKLLVSAASNNVRWYVAVDY